MKKFHLTGKPLTVLGLLLVTLAGAAWFIRSRKQPQLVQPRVGPVIEAIYGLGTVISPRVFHLRSAVNQSVQKVMVREGDSVKAGSPLMKLDESGVQKAPFAGTVTQVSLHEGEILTPQASALTLVQMEDLYIEISLEQQIVLNVRPGLSAQIAFENMKFQKLRGRVHSVFPREGQFVVRVDLEGFPKGVMPGMTADVAIEAGRKEKALLVPLRALFQGRVTLQDGRRRRKVPVSVGIVDGEWAEITSGEISPNSRIVIRDK